VTPSARDRSSVTVRLIAYLVRAVAFDINGATAAPPGTDIRRRRPFEASVANMQVTDFGPAQA